LIAVIPQGKAKHYKIRLSVMPIEDIDDPINNNALSSGEK